MLCPILLRLYSLIRAMERYFLKMKMLCISWQKSFSFLRYSFFHIFSFPSQPSCWKGLMGTKLKSYDLRKCPNILLDNFKTRSCRWNLGTLILSYLIASSNCVFISVGFYIDCFPVIWEGSKLFGSSKSHSLFTSSIIKKK